MGDNSICTPTEEKLTYFGINLGAKPNDPHALIHKKLFKNVIKRKIYDGAVLKLNEPKIVEYNYNSFPILASNFDILHSITYGIEDESIIMNRNTLLALASDEDKTFKIFPITRVIHDEKKTFYVLHVVTIEDLSKKYKKKCKYGATFEDTIIQKNTEHLTYSCHKKFINLANDEKMPIYYTSQQDSFENGEPTEIKALEFAKKYGFSLSEEIKTRIVLQCKLGGVKNVIVGFYNSQKRVDIKRYTVDELNVGKVKENVSGALKLMKENLINIIKTYKIKWNGQSVEIKKTKLRTCQDIRFKLNAELLNPRLQAKS